MRITILFLIALLIVSCEEDEYNLILQLDDKVENFYRIVKVNSKVDLGMETNSPDMTDTKISYICSDGIIRSERASMVFVAPSRPGKVKITKTVETGESDKVNQNYNILVYRQFIILKADDLIYEPGDIISDRWTKYFNFIREKGIKSSVGIVGVSLLQGNIQYLERVRELHTLPNFEIWNHGYMHIVNAKDDEGKIYSEYQTTPYEYQKEMVEKSQDMARGRLGFKIRTFGAPGNAIDNTTTRVINEDDEIAVWFYGNENTNKYLIPRLHDIEYPYGVPDFTKFVAAYDPDEKMYSLQVHPNMWNQEQFNEFKEIINFLMEHDVIFMNPYEYYKYSGKLN